MSGRKATGFNPERDSKRYGEAEAKSGKEADPMKTMNEVQMQVIAARAAAIAKEIVLKQIGNGSSKQGMTKARHIAVVADTLVAALIENAAAPAGVDQLKWDRMVLRAALGGSLLNSSQLRQDMEKAGVLEKEVKMLGGEYGIED